MAHLMTSLSRVKSKVAYTPTRKPYYRAKMETNMSHLAQNSHEQSQNTFKYKQGLSHDANIERKKNGREDKENVEQPGCLAPQYHPPSTVRDEIVALRNKIST